MNCIHTNFRLLQDLAADNLYSLRFYHPLAVTPAAASYPFARVNLSADRGSKNMTMISPQFDGVALRPKTLAFCYQKTFNPSYKGQGRNRGKLMTYPY